MANTEMSGESNTSKCNYCKKLGHSEENCWHKNANHNNHKGNYTRSLRPCKHCGGSHMDHKCWELPQNSGNRPPNWKTKITNETANIMQDMSTDQRVELLLSNVDRDTQLFPGQKDVLFNPNIWAYDSS
jgi:hypothetical protein